MSILIRKILQERFSIDEDINENAFSYTTYKKVAGDATNRALHSDQIDDHMRAEFAHLKAAGIAPSHDEAKYHIAHALSHFKEIHR